MSRGARRVAFYIQRVPAARTTTTRNDASHRSIPSLLTKRRKPGQSPPTRSLHHSINHKTNTEPRTDFEPSHRSHYSSPAPSLPPSPPCTPHSTPRSPPHSSTPSNPQPRTPAVPHSPPTERVYRPRRTRTVAHRRRGPKSARRWR